MVAILWGVLVFSIGCGGEVGDVDICFSENDVQCGENNAGDDDNSNQNNQSEENSG